MVRTQDELLTKFTRQRIYNKPAMAYEYSMVSTDLINNWDMFVNINSSY